MLLAGHELAALGFAVDVVVGRTDGALCGDVPEQATLVELGRAAKLKVYSRIAIGDPGILPPLICVILLAREVSGKLGSLPSGLPPL
jgi:hypothetical protein